MKKHNLIFKIRVYISYLFIPFLLLIALFYYYNLQFAKENSLEVIDTKMDAFKSIYEEEYFDRVKRDILNIEKEIKKLNTESLLFKDGLNSFSSRSNTDIKSLYYIPREGDITILPRNKKSIEKVEDSLWYQNTKLTGLITYTPYVIKGFNSDKLIVSKAVFDTDGRIDGVLALGISLNDLLTRIQSFSFVENYNYLNEKGEVIGESYIDKGLLKEVEVEEGSYSYLVKSKLFYNYTFSKFDISIIGLVGKSYFKDFYRQMHFRLLISIVMALSLYLIISTIIIHLLKRDDKILRDLIAKVSGKKDLAIEQSTNLENLYSEVEKVLESYKSVKREAFVDPLTKIYNRNFLNKHLEDIINKHEQACLLLFDLDKFKAVNDNLGHDVGDGVLKRIGSTLKSVITEKDIPVRYGGDEFLVVFLDAELINCYKTAEIFRAKVESLNWREAEIEVTVSGGLVEYKKGLEKSMVEADKLLYEAKKEGRNKIVIDI